MNSLSEIIAECKRNNRKSQEELYRQFYPALFALCKKFFADEHEIQTALNNGMMKVFKNISQYDATKGEFFNWVYTVVRNSCLTLLRSKKPEFHLELNDDTEYLISYDPFETVEWEEVFNRLNRLPPATRAICSLYYLENFTVKEIGQEMNIKEGTVKWHLNESRNKIRDGFTKNKEI